MSMFNDIIRGSKDNDQECIANATFVSIFAKRFSPGRWSFLGPGSEKKRYSTYIDTTLRMGQSRWIDDDQIRRKRTPSFPCHESKVPRNAQKQRSWKIINTLLCRWGYDWNSFSHNNFCSSAQYSRSSLRCVWGIRYFSNASTPLIEIPAQDFFFAKVQRKSGKALTTRSIDKNLY